MGQIGLIGLMVNARLLPQGPESVSDLKVIMMFRLTTTFALCFLLTIPLFAQQEAEDAPADDDDSEVFSRVVPVFDPGSHTRPICAMGFTTDKSKLITVGEDFTVQVWSTATGQRIDVLRLFPYGREASDNYRDWDTAVVSPDGRFVAIGGGKRSSQENERKNKRPKLVLVDVEKRTVRVIDGPGSGTTALAFSPDGTRLAAAFRRDPTGIHIYSDLSSPPESRRQRRDNQVLKDPEADRSPTMMQFSPDGNHLVSAVESRDLIVWDLTKGQSKLVAKLDLPGSTRTFCWSPDSKTFIRTWSTFSNAPHGLEVRSAKGEQIREYLFTNEAPLTKSTIPWFVAYVGPSKLLLTTYGRISNGEPGSQAIRFDLNSGRAEHLLDDEAPYSFPVMGAITQDGQLGAMTTTMGLDALIFRLKDGSVVARCGAGSPIPTVVGWAGPGQPAGFGWSEERKGRRNNTEAQDLQFGFDLTKLEPVGNFHPESYTVGHLTQGEWSVSRNKDQAGLGSNEASVMRGDVKVGSLKGGNTLTTATLIPQGDAAPLVAWSSRMFKSGSGSVSISKADGALVARLLPKAVFVRDICPSPDGRLLIVSGGTHRMCVYPTDGSKTPLISVARVRGEWVAWSGEGYYTASPGGEKMIGWAVGNGAEQLATFHTAEKFAKHFRRPDLLRKAVELGSMELALKQAETRAPKIDQLLPPKCELKLLKQEGNHVKVQATAVSEAKDKPVIALRVLLDRRHLPRGVGSKTLKQGESATTTWEFDIPPGTHELKLLARNEDSSAESEALVIKGVKTADHQPVLHRLCIGVDEYNLSALNLTTAAKDARDVYAALEKHCVGTDNRFGKAQGILLLNRNATRTAVLNAIAEVRKAANQGDLVVLHFAGHGIKQQDDYYLLTHEANPNQSLKGHSVSGRELRQALVDIECPVVLLLDACHSGGGVKSFRPATDDVSRELTDDETGVTVLAAAGAHEVASSTEENGYFTAAFVKALEAGKGVPVDPYDHVLYTHNAYNVIFSEVRRASKGKQNPFLNGPTAALREVPQSGM